MNSDNIAIRVSHLSKQYSLGGPQEPYHTLRDAIVNSLKVPLKVFHKAPPVEGFWALKDVSFDIEQGEIVGIIGRNGAGKSTLLKILSRITSPTEGTVELHGRVGSLLEVGTGFHPELTGRENIYLSGSILGMKRREIDAKMDEIVKFSEIEKFLDTPVKRYSSGMYVRLAFAVAAHLEPEILLVDEVLAVGDAAFQKKCLGKMGEVSKEGRTVLFVSHNMNAVRTLCNSCIFIREGNVALRGDPESTIKQYLDLTTNEENRKTNFVFQNTGNKSAWITSLQLKTREKISSSVFNILEPFEIVVNFEVNYYYEQLFMQCEVHSLDGTRLFLTMDSDWENYHALVMKDQFPKNPGKYQFVISFPAPLLNVGIYELEIYLTTGPVRIDTIKGIIIQIQDNGSFTSYVRKESRGGSICPVIRWEMKTE
jgi:lipopolysaccharide transport system ATP-binding protein